MTAATNRRNRRAQARSRRRAGASWTGRADRLTTMQVGGTTGTMSWFSRGAMRNQYETGVIKATYSYTDINNNLRVANDSAGLTTSTYDGDNLRRKIVSGSVATTFVWDGADYLQIKPSSGDATLLVVLEGEVVGHVKGSEKRDYIVDPLGSVVAYLNSSQTLTDQLEYWPYGEMVAEVEAGTEPFLWVRSLGYFRDSDLRTYIRAREYRQDLGSWMQLDPLWPAMKPFAYAGGSGMSGEPDLGRLCFRWFGSSNRTRFCRAEALGLVEWSWSPDRPSRCGRRPEPLSHRRYALATTRSPRWKRGIPDSPRLRRANVSRPRPFAAKERGRG